jgi:hypothetical protein
LIFKYFYNNYRLIGGPNFDSSLLPLNSFSPTPLSNPIQSIIPTFQPTPSFPCLDYTPSKTSYSLPPITEPSIPAYSPPSCNNDWTCFHSTVKGMPSGSTLGHPGFSTLDHIVGEASGPDPETKYHFVMNKNTYQVHEKVSFAYFYLYIFKDSNYVRVIDKETGQFISSFYK